MDAKLLAVKTERLAVLNVQKSAPTHPKW